MLWAASVYGNTVYLPEGPGAAWTRILEVENYLEYLDLDQDLLPEWWEEQYGFSPIAYDDFTLDTDSDGLSDEDEYKYQTSPITSDTDGDQMPDEWELSYGLDPRDASDGNADLDGDGESNRQEFLNGTDPSDASSNSIPSVPPPSATPGGGGGAIGWSLAVLLILRLICRQGIVMRAGDFETSQLARWNNFARLAEALVVSDSPENWVRLTIRAFS